MVVSDNRKFWQTLSPLFSEKAILTKNQELAETFNTFFGFFSNTTQNLKIDSIFCRNYTRPSDFDPVLKAMKKYEKYRSIIKIKEKMKNKNSSFTCSFVTKETILNELRKLNHKKTCQESYIPVKIIKDKVDIVYNFVYNNFNNSLFSSNFPSYLKMQT